MRQQTALTALAFVAALGLGALAYLASSAVTGGAESKPTRESIPEIAGIAGVRIGYSTQDDLAKCWGEGKTVIGGHPNSGRVWRVKGTPWVLHTDGFEYSERGLVVHDLEVVEATDSDKDAPYARLDGRELAWLGGVTPGMSRAKVKEFLKRKSLSLKETERGFAVSASGFYPCVTAEFRKWTVQFGFTNERLTYLGIGAGW
jgi:hypothetical protein